MLSAGIILFFAAVSLPAPQQEEQTRTVVKTDSRIEFHASATFEKVTGVFHSWEADLKMPPDDFAKAFLNLEMDSESVTTGSGLRDKETKGKNFFDVKEYPKVTFASKSITANSDPSKFHMDAELTLRGMTKPVSVVVTLHPQPNGHQWVDGDFSFNRRDFGMTHNVPFNKVANTILVQFHLDVTGAPASPAAQSQP
jgi:polyisoprenoid-binding protein YceI